MVFMAERARESLFYFFAIFRVHPAHVMPLIYPRGVPKNAWKIQLHKTVILCNFFRLNACSWNFGVFLHFLLCCELSESHLFSPFELFQVLTARQIQLISRTHLNQSSKHFKPLKLLTHKNIHQKNKSHRNTIQGNLKLLQKTNKNMTGNAIAVCA